MYEVRFEKGAEKKFKSLDGSVRKRLAKYLDRIAQSGEPRASGHPLSNVMAGKWVYKPMPWRIVCKIDDDNQNIIVLDIDNRDSIYERKNTMVKINGYSYYVIGENYNRRNAYSSSKQLEKAIKYDAKKCICNEAINFEFDRENLGGIIVLSTDVNAVQLDKNKIKNWVKQKVATLYNRFFYKNKIDKRSQEKDLAGWTIGKYLNGRYTAKNGKTFSENSISIEILGVTFDTLIDIATKLCDDFDQEAVLVKDYASGRVLFVNAD